jgi:hypothetical protein
MKKDRFNRRPFFIPMPSHWFENVRFYADWELSGRSTKQSLLT